MSPEFWDAFWVVAKYTAPIVTGAFGFYALVEDFRVEKDGRRVLSAKAYWGMALLIVGTALAVGGDAHKDRKDDETTQKTADSLKSVSNDLTTVSQHLDDVSGKLKGAVQTLGDTKTQVDKNLGTTSSVLQETLNVADPMDRDFAAIYARIGVSPKNPLAQAYIKRVMPEHSSYFEFNVGDKGFPDSKQDGAQLANLAGFTKVSVRFYDPARGNKGPELSLFGVCDKSGGGVGRGTVEKQISYQAKETALEISCMTPNVNHFIESGTDTVRSYRELRGFTVFVRVTLLMNAGDAGIDFNLPQVSLITPTSRWLDLPALKRTSCPGLSFCFMNRIAEDDSCFEAQIPKNFRF